MDAILIETEYFFFIGDLVSADDALVGLFDGGGKLI